MTVDQKDQYLEQAKTTLEHKREVIVSELQRIPEEILTLKHLSQESEADKLSYQTMIATYRKRYDDLQHLQPSPYFNSCLIKFDGEKDFRELYFSKFAFDQENIYSWASPISQIRFEAPGDFKITSIGGEQGGEIIKKDQYLINDGKILFLSTESQDAARELIYQEYFSSRKTAFVLPEIVAQMEKAQDQVIRSSFGGKLVVTGPAGSGKTTLALHRVAYLLQSPETSDQVSDGEVIVFVQDESTRDYFSHLLPELGIRDVEITTLAAWAKNILPLADWTITEHETDAEASYVWAKVQGLRAQQSLEWQTDWFKLLQETYDAYLDQVGKARLVAQKKNKQLDRLDLAVLLRAIAGSENCFQIEKDYYSLVSKSKELKRKKGKFKADYKLMIIDEFQNYLPEHLAIFSQAINRTIGEMVYIGDFNQRVRLGTVNNLSGIGAELSDDRLVKLSKVYRNTKEILIYLKQLGFDVVVPEMIKTGPRVEELILTPEAELEYLAEKLVELKEVSVGILSHNEELLKTYQQHFGQQGNVKVMSLIDSQGVEFDAVFLVGVDEDLLSVKNLPPALQAEVGQIKKDLLYIALTRAMNSLTILGREHLSLS